MTSIRLSGIRKRYGAHLAVDIDSLKIADGEIVCIVGPSGCGKTTVLRTIAGLIRHDEGDLYFGDRPVSDLPPERRNAAMVFQNYALFPHMTVYENIAFGLTVRRLPKAAIDVKVRAVLELVQLPDVSNRYPRQLSGGQQQRIAVARALATEPDILLFDEPLSNLDAKLREYMRFELRRLLERIRVTTVYVTHDQTEAMVISDRMIVMNAGRVVQDGPPSEVYRRPSNRFVADFIGTGSFVSGVIAGKDGALLKLQTPEGRTLWASGADLGQGAEAIACVRPEAIRVVENGADTGRSNHFEAVIETATDLGESCELHLSTDIGRLRARVPSSSRLRPGERIVIEILTERCVLTAP